MNFVVKYSLQKDLNNYLVRLYNKNRYSYGRAPDFILKKFPLSFQQQIKKSKSVESIIGIIKKYWQETRPKNFSSQIKLTTKSVEKILNQNKDKIISKLESVYQQKFPFNKIAVFLTTIPICPYNYQDRWFMVSSTDKKQIIKTATHELNHFMFYYYYADHLKQKNISSKNIEIIKESLAILTNPEGNPNKPDVLPLEKIILSHTDKSIDQIIDILSNYAL